MASGVIKLSAILLLVAVFGVRVSHSISSPPPVDNVCLDCLCEVVSGCDRSIGCDQIACGLFYITHAYWADAGKPTINGLSTDSPDAYPTCTKDPYCASLAVQGYMRKFAQDCNGDGRIDCYDYMAIHKRGGYGCVGALPSKYENDFKQCIADAQNKNADSIVRLRSI